MSEKKGRPAVAFVLGILILITAAIFTGMVRKYADESWRQYALWILAIVMAFWLLAEIRSIIRYIRTTGESGLSKVAKNAVSALVLINEFEGGIRTWDLRNKTGLVIGRSSDSSDVDIDLSDTEYFSFISNQHAVLNFTEKGWMLTDAGSQNGTALEKHGTSQRLLLAPGEPAPICTGDTIYIAEETRLAVK